MLEPKQDFMYSSWRFSSEQSDNCSEHFSTNAQHKIYWNSKNKLLQCDKTEVWICINILRKGNFSGGRHLKLELLQGEKKKKKGIESKLPSSLQTV